MLRGPTILCEWRSVWFFRPNVEAIHPVQAALARLGRKSDAFTSVAKSFTKLPSGTRRFLRSQSVDEVNTNAPCTASQQLSFYIRYCSM